MLLAQTDYSMKEIAERLGFSNQYYFSKVFKENNGVSPSQYRKSNIKDNNAELLK
jgi:AraC-like DNA-binding protein